MLFRVTRGKALLHFSDAFQQDKQQRVVYLVVFQNGEVLRDRVNKVCDSFLGSRYEFNDLGDPLFAEAARVRVQILEDRQLLKLSKQQLREYLRSINGKCDPENPSQLELFHHFVAKEKALAACLNMMVLRSNTYVGFVWCPFELEEVIKRELEHFVTTEFLRWRADTEAPHEI